MIRKLIIQDKKKSSEIKVDGRIKNFSLKKKKGSTLYIFHSISEIEVWNR